MLSIKVLSKFVADTFLKLILLLFREATMINIIYCKNSFHVTISCSYDFMSQYHVLMSVQLINYVLTSFQFLPVTFQQYAFKEQNDSGYELSLITVFDLITAHTPIRTQSNNS